MWLVHSILTNQELGSLDENDIVDGGQDKQIDVITIDEEPDRATVYVLQTKFTQSFESNRLIQMGNGLDWLFRESRTRVNTLPNLSFRDKITDFRSVQGGHGPSNLTIICRFVTNGLTTALSNEFRDELERIRERYDNDTFAHFSIEPWGADELVVELNRQERAERTINTDLKIRCDAYTPSLIKYDAEGLKGLVCTASAKEIARVVNEDTDGFIFDSNLRQFKGLRGSVNPEILSSCTDADRSRLFWFLNNGITIVCDRFDAVTDPDDAKVKLTNMQIVNGCQTATVLAEAARSGALRADVRVLLRIYETNDVELVNQVVITTNNQNKITSRDLRANDAIQVDMESAFRGLDLFYERKPHQYRGSPAVDIQKVVSNELVGQAYLAIALKRPSDARRRKYKVWGEDYSRIFKGHSVEPHAICYLAHRRAERWLQESDLKSDREELIRKLAKNGSYHLARVGVFLWCAGDDWPRRSPSSLRAEIDRLGNPRSRVLDRHWPKAFEFLKRILRRRKHRRDLDLALKSTEIENDINRGLQRTI